MALKNREIHVFAAFGTLILSAALIVPTVWFTSAAAQSEPVLKDRLVIEASLAYKADKTPSQPQKPKHEPDPVAKPVGVSHDETKPVDPKPPDVTKPVADADPLAKFKRPDQDDNAPGAPTKPGNFDGDKLGHGDVTKGDPYFGKLKAELENMWSPPKLAKSGATVPEGCIHMTNDGKIVDIKFSTRTEDDFQPLAEATLKAFQAAHNEHPEQVPTHLLDVMTTQWLCFKFNAT